MNLSYPKSLLNPVPPGLAVVAMLSTVSAGLFVPPAAADPAGDAASAGQQTFTVRTVPVQVEARLLHAEPAGPLALQQFVFAITVHAARGDQVISTAVSSNSLDDALKAVRNGTVWHAPYLYLHIDRGTGNRLDSSREAIFAVENGKLRPLGQLVDRGEAQAAYRGRRFVDYWGTEPAQSAGLCRVCVPLLTVKLVDRDGKLEVRRSATWSANESLWQTNAAIIAQPPRTGGTDLDSEASFSARLSYFQAVVKNAVLAKYCWKTTELNQLLASATPHLNAEQREDLQDSLAAVVPLTPPSDARPSLYALNAGIQGAGK